MLHTNKINMKTKVTSALLICTLAGTAISARNLTYSPDTIIGIGPDKAFPHYLKDDEMRSPKSVLFDSSGKHFFVEALEEGKTLVYSLPELKKISSLKHHFSGSDSKLHQSYYAKGFLPYSDKLLAWNAKPVEGVIDDNKQLLYVTSYRKDYDANSMCGSSVTIIDTKKNQIIGSLPTRTIPKIVTLSHDTKTLCVTNWGDNSVTLWDVANSPRDIRVNRQISLGAPVDQSRIKAENKDKECGLCLRGTTFTLDDRYIMTSGLHAGGTLYMIDRFDGKVTKLKVPFSPIRHIVGSKKLDKYFFSTTGNGSICSINNKDILEAQKNHLPVKNTICQKMTSPVRTLAIHEESGVGAAALNMGCQIAVFNLQTLKVIQTLPAPCYQVGLRFSPDGKTIVSTAQGKKGIGGNKIAIYHLI